MRTRTARWVAGCIAAGSIALMAGGLALAYADRHLVPAGLTNWDFSDVFGALSNVAVPVLGFVLASRRPGNRLGWLALAAGLALRRRSSRNSPASSCRAAATASAGSMESRTRVA